MSNNTTQNTISCGQSRRHLNNEQTQTEALLVESVEARLALAVAVHTLRCAQVAHVRVVVTSVGSWVIVRSIQISSN